MSRAPLDDNALDALLGALGTPAGALPETSAARILALAAPPIAAPVPKVGVPRWVLAGSVAASLFAGFVGGAVATRAGPADPVSPEGVPAADLATGPLAAGPLATGPLAEGPLASVSPTTSPLGLLPGPDAAASTATAPSLTAPSLTAPSLTPTARAAASPAALPAAGSRAASAAGRAAVGRARSPSGPAAGARSTPATGSSPAGPTEAALAAAVSPALSPRDAAFTDTPVVASTSPSDAPPALRAPDPSDERPDLSEATFALAPRRRTHADAVVLRDPSPGPWSIGIDLGGQNFRTPVTPLRDDQPPDSLGLRTGAALRLALLDEGIVRPTLEVGADIGAALVPSVGPPQISPHLGGEVLLALGTFSPAIGWGVNAGFRFGPGPEGAPDPGQLVETGPSVGFDVGNRAKPHLRVRLDLTSAVASIADGDLKPRMAIDAGVEIPLGRW